MTGRWLVTGAGGMVAGDLLRLLGDRGVGLDRRALDICQADQVEQVIGDHRPEVVVNCAAWTAVDDAELHEEQARAVNADGVRHLAEACSRTGSRLIHLSTDYVFPGDATSPYAEDAPTGPRSAYGRTKLAGEQAVLEVLPGTGYVVRTAWLYGTTGRDFVRTMMKLESEREYLDVVYDQVGQPTWSADLAALLVRLGESGAEPGIYHGTSSGQCSWHALASEVFRLLGADPSRVRPVGSAAFPRPAPRPAYSVLGHARWAGTGVAPIGDWNEALSRAFPEVRRSLYNAAHAS